MLQAPWVALPCGDGDHEANALEAELLPVPLKDGIHLGWSGGVQWVTYRMLHERVKTPESGWSANEQDGFLCSPQNN